MSKGFSSVLTASAVVGALFLLPPSASASWFSHHHPRQAEVNQREWNQQHSINEGMRSGRINPSEAAHLEGEEAAIRRQEQDEVRANGGSLTKQQYRQLNREENALSHEIYQDQRN